MWLPRHLLCCGAVVAVFSVAEPGTLQGEAREKAKHFLAAGGFVEVLAGNSERFREACRNARVIVNALFGSGFHGALPEESRKFVEIVNDTRSRRERAQIVAIDIPSGVDATTGAISDLAINADLTVAIQAAKLGHLIEPGASASGRILVVDVGVHDVPGR